jgi:acyl-CoA synthetase (AMP-forming)/AMP-acid ligase II
MMRYFIPEDWIVLVESSDITTAFLAPYFLAQILESPILPHANMASLKTLNCGGDYIPPKIILSALDRLPGHIELRFVYGLTETTFDVAMLRPKDFCTRENAKYEARLSTIGKTMPGVSAIIANSNDSELPAGSIGELLVHTPRKMLGYIDSETHQIIPHNSYWLHTGDLGYMDQDGYIFLTGKKSATSSK